MTIHSMPAKLLATELDPVLDHRELAALEAGIVDNANLRAFVLAGNSIFTVENTATGGRFTFKVKLAGKPDDKASGGKVWFVGLLTGPDNTSNYQYMGAIFAHDNGPTTYRITSKSRIGSNSPSQKAFSWLFNRIVTGSALPEGVNVYHMGRCGRCGRALTVPESIRTGLGPICAGKE